MRKRLTICIALACGAAIMTSVPAVAQKKTKQQAMAECKAQFASAGRAASHGARQQEMQACVKAKMQGKR